MARLAIDIDDTLYSFAGLARQIMADLAADRGDKQLQRAAYAPWDEWRSPPDLLGSIEPWLEIIELCHTDEQIMSQVPYQGAAETLWDLIHDGHSLTFISNRTPDAQFPTWAWLDALGFPIGSGNGDSVIIEHRRGTAAEQNTRDGFSYAKLICTAKDKAPFIDDCQYIIDDRPKTLVSFTTDFTWRLTYGSQNKERRRLGFGLVTPFNRSLTDVANVYLAPNWSLLRHGLIEKGVLNGHSKPAALSGAVNS